MSEVVSRIAKKCDLPKSTVTNTLHAMRDLIIDGLGKGEEFELRGFGRFTTIRRKPRYHVVPTRPGERIRSKAKTSIKFVPSIAGLKDI